MFNCLWFKKMLNPNHNPLNTIGFLFEPCYLLVVTRFDSHSLPIPDAKIRADKYQRQLSSQEMWS